MKLRNYVLLGVASLSLGAAAIASQPAQASAASVPARMRHNWHANKWGESYYLNCHKYHANFYDGAWHTLYYSSAGYNKYNLNPAHHSYGGITMKYKSAHSVTVHYDTAYLHFTRGSSHKKNGPKYKWFHGYRIEGRKDVYTSNTFYDKDTHATLSSYRPTQMTKVIFEYGSHVIPTHHEWDYIPNKSNYVTEYRCVNGAWRDMGTISTK